MAEQLNWTEMFFWSSLAFSIIQQMLAIIFGSSAFSKYSLNTWKFTVHILLKPGFENFEHYFANVWDECNCMVVWTFFGIVFLWDWNENWPNIRIHVSFLWRAQQSRFWKKDMDSFSGKLTKLYFYSESFYAWEQGKSLQKSRLHRWSLSMYKVDNSKFTKLMKHIDSIFSGSRENLLSSRPDCYSQHYSHAVLKSYMQEMFLRAKHRDMPGGSGPLPDPCEDLLLKAVM